MHAPAAADGESVVFIATIRFFEVLAEWVSRGRFPREELRFRWWIPFAVLSAFLLVTAVGVWLIWLLA